MNDFPTALLLFFGLNYNLHFVGLSYFMYINIRIKKRVPFFNSIKTLTIHLRFDEKLLPKLQCFDFAFDSHERIPRLMLKSRLIKRLVLYYQSLIQLHRLNVLIKVHIFYTHVHCFQYVVNTRFLNIQYLEQFNFSYTNVLRICGPQTNSSRIQCDIPTMNM